MGVSEPNGSEPLDALKRREGKEEEEGGQEGREEEGREEEEDAPALESREGGGADEPKDEEQRERDDELRAELAVPLLLELRDGLLVPLLVEPFLLLLDDLAVLLTQTPSAMLAHSCVLLLLLLLARVVQAEREEGEGVRDEAGVVRALAVPAMT